MSTSTFSSAGPALAAQRPLQTEARSPSTEAVPAVADIPAVAPFRNHRPSPRRWWALLSVAAWLALWWLATELRWVPPLFLPPSEAVVKAFVVVMDIFVIGAIALLLGGLLCRLEQWLLPWHGR